MTCKGIYVNDTLNTYRFPFYDSDGKLTKKYYHISIKCTNKAIESYDLCEYCKIKENKLKTYSIINNILKSNKKSSVSHPSVLHGKIGEPIPIWSHIEGGEWFKSMLNKGYKKENMAPKKKEDKEDKETKKPKETKETKEIKEPKKKTTVVKVKKQISKVKETNDVIENLMPKMYIDNTQKEEVYDIVKLEVKRITILDKEYYYESTKDKVYTLDYDYVGRYDKKNNILCTTYPDSDIEPDI
jgi:hypothetical protein